MQLLFKKYCSVNSATFTFTHCIDGMFKYTQEGNIYEVLSSTERAFNDRNSTMSDIKFDDLITKNRFQVF